MKLARNSKLSSFVVIGSLALSQPAAAAELITNGDFSSGLSNWTVFTTLNGVVNSSPADFDVTGGGTQTAARLNVGQQTFSQGFPAGGGLRQTVVSIGAIGTFSADIAAFTLISNAQGGIFSVLLNGVEKDQFTVGDILANTTRRSVLSFTGMLNAGENTIELRITRPFGSAPTTPFQYITNVSLTEQISAVPEPATWLMMLLGFGAIGYSMRSKKKSVPSVQFA